MSRLSNSVDAPDTKILEFVLQEVKKFFRKGEGRGGGEGECKIIVKSFIEIKRQKKERKLL